MLFNSVAFIVFFAIFITLWPLLRKNRNVRLVYLVVASFIFYGWWDWRCIFLLVGIGMVDFVAALGIERYPRHRKLWLVLALVSTLGTLATFKYLDFAVTNLNWLMSWFGADSLRLPHVLLPVGISFYTFHAMSYAVDVYRGHVKTTHNPFHFLAYLALFPLLLAGPIARAAQLMPQLEEVRRTTYKSRWEGLYLILFGYAKKVVVADNLAALVKEATRGDLPQDSGALWWLVMIVFAFQIYCDFSGYSDIARGLAKWMGYDFPVNFDHPYISASFREFWTRWHISLSSWFRDYVYIPLGGSRRGAIHGHLNMWISMLLSGFWHGAQWTMIIWGALHALYLSAERVSDWPKRLARIPGGRHLAVLVVFILAVLAWVPFLASSSAKPVQQMVNMWTLMFDPSRFRLDIALQHVTDTHLFLILVMLLRQAYYHLRLNEVWQRTYWPQRIVEPVALAVIVWACVYLRGPAAEFIYFQF